MSDDRPKFVGVFRGAGMSFGPKPYISGSFEVSAKYTGTGTYAVDERGVLYHLCNDWSTRNAERVVWVQVRPEIIRNPDEAE